MTINHGVLIICIALFLVVGINVMIYLSVTSKETSGQINLFRQAAGRVKEPWADEERDLQELSRMVATLKKNPTGDQEDPKPPATAGK